MGGGIGAWILVIMGLAAGLTVMLLVQNARWKSAAELVREARRNVVGAVLLVLIGAGAVLLSVYVISELF
jgi:hypothetical protein